MDGISDKNFEQEQFQSGDVLTSAPPPPSEVKIRTMRSDLESMAASGGGMPRFENVKVTGLSAAAVPQAAIVRTQSKKNLLDIVLVIVLVIVLIIAGWLAYMIFGKGSLP